MRGPVTRGCVLLMTTLLLAGCGGADRPTADEPTPAEQPATAASEPTEELPTDPVEQFLQVTADHMCEVQGQIYDSPEDLAKAYGSAPDYPGLEAALVSRLQRRLQTDADFSGRLNERVTRSCG